jgi:hypothetical protein
MRAVLLAVTTAVLAGTAAAQEAQRVTVDAFSVLTAHGSVVAVAADVHVFAGTMSGPYFIDTGEGPIPAGNIACAGMLEADEATGRQKESGRCRLVAIDGAVAFGEFTCDGFRLVGCAGPFAITGGEGRLAGAAGEGRLTLRRYETGLAVNANGTVSEAALGIAAWKDFHVTLAAAE